METVRIIARCPHCIWCFVVHSQSCKNLSLYFYAGTVFFYSGGPAVCCSTCPDSNRSVTLIPLVSTPDDSQKSLATEGGAFHSKSSPPISLKNVNHFSSCVQPLSRPKFLFRPQIELSSNVNEVITGASIVCVCVFVCVDVVHA